MENRVVVTLMPNPNFMTIHLNYKLFNKEQYSWTRKKQAAGAEKVMLKRLELIPGVKKVEPSRSELRLELSEGANPGDFLERVLNQIKIFSGKKTEATVVLRDGRCRERYRNYNEMGYPVGDPIKVNYPPLGLTFEHKLEDYV